MSAAPRLLSPRVLVLVLCTVLAAVALVAALSPGASGHRGTVLGAGHSSARKVSVSNVVWN